MPALPPGPTGWLASGGKVAARAGERYEGGRPGVSASEGGCRVGYSMEVSAR
jgi:hypothetical protein